MHAPIHSLQSLVNSSPLKGFRISERWGVVAEVGYQAVPDVLLMSQRELRLSSGEINVLLHLAAHWWRKDDFVFPGVATIARRMDVTPRTVQRLIGSLAKKEMVKKAKTKDGRVYFDLGPLREKLTPIAERVLAERRALRAEPIEGKEQDRHG